VPLTAQQAPPDSVAGAWRRIAAGRGADPKSRGSARDPGSCLKGTYKTPGTSAAPPKNAATKRGEPLATPAVDCIPYGYASA
jgi:hypothetical protein